MTSANQPWASPPDFCAFKIHLHSFSRRAIRLPTGDSAACTSAIQRFEAPPREDVACAFSVIQDYFSPRSAVPSLRILTLPTIRGRSKELA